MQDIEVKNQFMQDILEEKRSIHARHLEKNLLMQDTGGKNQFMQNIEKKNQFMQDNGEKIN